MVVVVFVALVMVGVLVVMVRWETRPTDQKLGQGPNA